jgi:hypothetical protein
MKILTSLLVATSLFGWFKQDRVTVKPDQMVCLPSSVCVPVSVLETEFKGYEDGQPAPALLLRQQVIDANRMFAAELEQKSMLQGQLARSRLKSTHSVSSRRRTRWTPNSQRHVARNWHGINSSADAYPSQKRTAVNSRAASVRQSRRCEGVRSLDSMAGEYGRGRRARVFDDEFQVDGARNGRAEFQDAASGDSQRCARNPHLLAREEEGRVGLLGV